MANENNCFSPLVILEPHARSMISLTRVQYECSPREGVLFCKKKSIIYHSFCFFPVQGSIERRFKLNSNGGLVSSERYVCLLIQQKNLKFTFKFAIELSQRESQTENSIQ